MVLALFLFKLTCSLREHGVQEMKRKMDKLSKEGSLHSLNSEGIVKPPLNKRNNTCKRILLVNDYVRNYEEELIEMLSAELVAKGHTVIKYSHADNIDDSFSGLETFCNENEIDLAVSYLTGCVFIGPLKEIPRLFIDPDWNELVDVLEIESEKIPDGAEVYSDNEAYRRFKISKQELNKVIRTKEENNVKRGEYPAICWITCDYIDNHINDILMQLRSFRHITYQRDMFPHSFHNHLIAERIDELIRDL